MQKLIHIDLAKSLISNTTPFSIINIMNYSVLVYNLLDTETDPPFSEPTPAEIGVGRGKTVLDFHPSHTGFDTNNGGKEEGSPGQRN